ncbi:hypothetical protein PTKIN_Ptkin03bG0086200 [Pterospermum kingtungense]
MASSNNPKQQNNNNNNNNKKSNSAPASKVTKKPLKKPDKKSTTTKKPNKSKPEPKPKPKPNKNKSSNGTLVESEVDADPSSSTESKEQNETDNKVKPNKRKQKEKVEENDEEEEGDETMCRFPMRRIKRIIKSEDPRMAVSQDVVFLVNKATEKFLQQFCEDGYKCSVKDRKKSLSYKHLSTVVRDRKKYDFLSGTARFNLFIYCFSQWLGCQIEFNLLHCLLSFSPFMHAEGGMSFQVIPGTAKRFHLLY